jgi:hypothetical protein
VSLLAPLYVLGALAVALPVIFHLIRRQIRERTPFSTVMFLPTSQPRLTRRSRLENLPLLLLRALALILLALAFSRPFLRSSATETSEGINRRVVVLVDTSASMRRGDLWNQALAQLRDVTQNLQVGDSLAVIAFDAEPAVKIGFDASGELQLPTLRTLGERLFAGEEPSWNSTDLAAALRLGAELATSDIGPQSAVELATMDGEDDVAIATRSASVETQMVLISDMQTGAALDSLQGFAWPSRLPVEVRRVSPSERTNAWITLPAEQQPAAVQPPDDAANASATRATHMEDSFRLRVSNAADSNQAQFRLNWITPQRVADAKSQLSVQVPAGQSRSIRLPNPPAEAMAIGLSGDDHDFDNIRYFAAEPPVERTLLFFGDDSQEPRESLFYYVSRLSLDTLIQRVTMRRHAPQEGPLPELAVEQVPLVVATGPIDPITAGHLQSYIRDGGRLAYVLPPAANDDVAQDSLRRLTGDDHWSVAEANVNDYSLLSRIDFTHPLFIPLADARFNDFSKIRFWTHRTVDSLPEGWKALASFDDGSPALLERIEGQGRMWIFTAGWQPIESQLALSTKFIPLMFGLFESSRGKSAANDRLNVGDPFPVISDFADGQPTIARLSDVAGQPDETIETSRIDRPGIYRITAGEQSLTFAVNLAESESHTEPMGDDELERFGVMLGRSVPEQVAAQAQRQLRDVELESQQQLWQWLLVGVLGLLGLETLLGGWIGRRSGKQALAGPATVGSN